MSDLEELYQEIIMEHSRNPRNFHALENADTHANGFNPFCGDSITLYLNVVGDVITGVGFQGSGCAISKASASLMTDQILGKTQAEAEGIFETFRNMLTIQSKSEFDIEDLGDLEVFGGVARFPTRVKCATLAWHTLRAAIRGETKMVLTQKG